ncbi:uncharacterized protein LOC134231694 [Saccostrea cucullata]|uniref:uncharacterized protein LOC134231694 n=1 Tax=Saccostrea cuccullata TaxID=36930 RepID=UPI002ED5B24F
MPYFSFFRKSWLPMDTCQTCLLFLLLGNVWLLNALKCGNMYLIGVEKCPTETNSNQESQNHTKDSKIKGKLSPDNAQGSPDNAQESYDNSQGSPDNEGEKYGNVQISDEGGDKNRIAIICTCTTVVIVLLGTGSVVAYRKRHICLLGGRLKCQRCLPLEENTETHDMNESQVPCMANTIQV